MSFSEIVKSSADLTTGSKSRSANLSVRHLLRRKTAADHEAVDAQFSALIETGDCGYREFLQRSAAAIFPLEQALVDANVECLLPDWNDRSRSASLRADLAELGIATSVIAFPPFLRGEAHQFGVLYVLEGSRLGAKVLIQRLQENLNYSTPLPLRYLQHGTGRPLWATFVERLENSAAVRLAPADAIAGARSAFKLFGLPLAHKITADSAHMAA